MEIAYHYKIPKDLSKLSKTYKNRIKKYIENKLIKDPIFFGKPLQHSLSGIRSARVDDFRIVYKIERKSIFILSIDHRKNIYTNIKNRKVRSS